jgi:hypothetical protein
VLQQAPSFTTGSKEKFWRTVPTLQRKWAGHFSGHAQTGGMGFSFNFTTYLFALQGANITDHTDSENTGRCTG